jgi:hypothetical protein
MILYLSYFYKHGELSIRLGFWWTAMSIADIIASFLGYALLHLRGHLGFAGWRWLFLIEVRTSIPGVNSDADLTILKGLLTFCAGMAAFVLMPPGPCQTANWIRGTEGWFTER